MSPLAEAVYDILRVRPGLADPRITYAELARALREAAEEFEAINPRNRDLYAALGEVAQECRRLGLPSLAALGVRADSRRPREAYYVGTPFRFRGEAAAAWREELEARQGDRRPPRREQGAPAGR